MSIRAVATALGYDRTSVVAHDIGNMVAYAYASMYPGKVERLVVMDAPIPGIGPLDAVMNALLFASRLFSEFKPRSVANKIRELDKASRRRTSRSRKRR